ncbi:MAG: hypothetical protein UW46_C0008G0010 [Candidatus Yanofskybacteria bacterium GW2011_GWF1_44_227]|nr:MAG: hypothetical protein UT69_C0003G0027 [Candidatus Yanofskybacteria bacterium GW2011_GWE1_40_10]KKT15334.1 MAG: hypothetical protein UV97_C0009G0010 [Candidatus Yanofskybacteria bacterium GW2011_GWF2_43_596]KKT52978.1 MAG: hypothetical protein UW46_C0008G0010 [Candidatus Yanofskybacteria bacterium GW2011_GWF1_44_227]
MTHRYFIVKLCGSCLIGDPFMILPIQLFIWDANGTIFDDKDVSDMSRDAIFDHFGVARPNPAEWADRVSSNILDLYHSFGIPLSVSREEINRIRMEGYVKNINEVRVRDGARDLLWSFRGIGLFPYSALISAEVPAIIDILLRRFNIKNQLGIVIAGAWPKKRYLEKFVDSTGLPRRRIAYFGDTAEDVRISNELGLVSIGLVNPTSYSSVGAIMAENPDLAVVDMKDLSQRIAYFRQTSIGLNTDS